MLNALKTLLTNGQLLELPAHLPRQTLNEVPDAAKASLTQRILATCLRLESTTRLCSIARASTFATHEVNVSRRRDQTDLNRQPLRQREPRRIRLGDSRIDAGDYQHLRNVPPSRKPKYTSRSTYCHQRIFVDSQRHTS